MRRAGSPRAVAGTTSRGGAMAPAAHPRGGPSRPGLAPPNRATHQPGPYIVGAMDSGRYSIEIEPEVRLWLENIPAHHYKQAERVADLLAEQPTTLDEPHSRHLGGKLRELRFRLGDAHQRITYWLAPGRRVVLLTVFRKTKMREQAEVDRAHAAQRLCEAEHEAAAEHDLYSRNLKENR